MVIKRYVHCDICGGKEIEYTDGFASIIPNDGTYSQVSCDSEGLDKSRIKFCLECWCWALQQKFDLQQLKKCDEGHCKHEAGKTQVFGKTICKYCGEDLD